MALPRGAVVPPERRAHIDGVGALLSAWAMPMGVTDIEGARWLKAAWLHDALRDAPAESELEHGPRAAARAAQEGETDQGVLDAVRYHSPAYARWGDVGKMLYRAGSRELGRACARPRRRPPA